MAAEEGQGQYFIVKLLAVVCVCVCECAYTGIISNASQEMIN